MESPLDLQKTIINGLRDLPESSLLEIAEYVFFVRQKALTPNQFQQQFEEMLMAEDLTLLEKKETAHLEDEFNNYQNRYPKEQ